MSMSIAGEELEGLEDPDLTPRWWLDRDDPERAAALLRSGDSVATTAAEHEALVAELGPRGLVCLHEDGQTWVWTASEARALERQDNRDSRERQGRAGVSPATSALEDTRLPPRRNTPVGPAARSRHRR